ncbi:prepilin peptidase [Nonomuraea roseoviolacea]|uniref:Leader peptidase (Prepilin peptidase)/N-methyltransferase n=1 Tax=Nonomuraea roseoviolacea subsp. carminata TaxID=160689 RepID=A0ABT1K8Y1_9ACTN|nr:A24 family peptidase [Nonomuraea roseoviolacea]MCP2350047.1 leader peptidase (prepilin peptidase)/N-methyltransferase [Nonomuraea roseoviolacea subsp. carminata]
MAGVVALAALAGLIAGPYVRALASGFGPAPDAPSDASDAPSDAHAAPPDAHAAPPDTYATPPVAQTTPPDTRAEARNAFARALRTTPLPAWPPYLEVVTAAVAALVTWRAGLPYLYLALAGTTLAVIDWRTSRLPDAVTLPSYPLLALSLIPTGELPRALLGAAALTAVYGALWLVRPAAMGFGDVKLAGLVGMAAAARGWEAWVVAAVAGQLLAALYALALLLTRRASRDTEFPLGPFMLLGALAAVCLA